MHSHAQVVLAATCLIWLTFEGIDRLVYRAWFTRWRRNLVLLLISQILVHLLAAAFVK